MIPAGNYPIKVVDAEIKVYKKHRKYISLIVEVDLGGLYSGQKICMAMVPWSDFNWMNNIRAFFSDYDIQTYLLDVSRDEETMLVISQLIVGQTSVGKVIINKYNGRSYNQVMSYRGG